ncbi:hypothetical protein [Chromohalobacter sp.]|uniref:hypothetical protein n=1 Tax=Chromohalobacter sp. TaxID=50740 RepID=UPI001D87964C|nr:hypothetical protein [Chromohalobacter sp.]NQY46692.1 hypothetical protein [Chromohalobacter sp.]
MQNSLHRNKENLESQGIIYPGQELCHHTLFFTSQRDSKLWPRQYRNVDHSTLQDYVTDSLTAMAKDFLRDHDTYIISTEYLFFSDEQSVHNTTSWLKDFFDEIEIIVFIRQPSKHYSSSQQQVIKASHEIATPSHYYYPFRAVIEAWQKKCKVRPIKYDEGTDSLQTLSDIINFEIGNFIIPQRQNESLSVEQMNTLEKIQKNIYQDSSNIFKKHLLSVSNITPRGLTKPTLKKGIAEYIDQNHRRDLNWLEENHGITFTISPKNHQLPKKLKNIEKCSVKDVYVTNDDKVEKYEATLMDALLKHATKTSTS